jgi:hypothetical protein
MTSRYHTAVAAAFVAAISVGCSDSGGPAEGFVVTGTIQNNTGAPVPANIRLLVAWVITSGDPDRSYVFGEGTIDLAAGTFRIQLDDPPPTAALNLGGLGVGIIFATTNQAVGNGFDIGRSPPGQLIGAAGRHGIIFIGDQAIQDPQWATQFNSGYGVGVGVDVENDFDRFEPAAASSVVLIIDDLANIDFVNWT